MSKLVLNDIGNIERLDSINNNFAAIEAEFQNKVLYRNNPVGEPNTIENDIDFNGNDLLNVGTLNGGDVTNLVGFGPAVDTAVAAAASATVQAGNAAISAASAAASAASAAALASSSESSLVSYQPAGAGAVPSTVQAKLRESVSVKDFGAVGDGVTDDYAAFLAAYNSLPAKGGTILIPATASNTYRLSQTLSIRKAVHIIGQVQGGNSSTGTVLLFDASQSGIVFGAYNTELYQTITPDGATGAQFSVLENVLVLSAGGTGSFDGVVLRISMTCRNVTARGFGRYGFRIYNSIGGGGSIEGDGNAWRLDGCKAILNGSHGLYVDGNDANVGLCDKFFGQLNGGYGIYENSLIGNTYVALDTVSNTLGSMWAARSSSAVTIVGFWEDGASPAVFGANVTCIGGDMGNAASSTTGFCMAGGVAYGAPYKYLNKRGTQNVGAALGVNDTSLSSLSFGANEESASTDAWKLKFDATYKGWTLQYADSTSFQPIHYPNSASALYTNKGFTGSVFQNGYAVKNAGAAYSSSLVRMLGTAAPVAGTFQQGDIFYNSAPAASGFIGWVCVTGGTPGTWKTFGAISA